MKQYKAGALFGAVIGLFVYLLVPIHSEYGQAAIFPTGNVVADSASYHNYVSNLPFSVFIWLTLEILGVGAGIIAQVMFRREYSTALP